MLCEAHHPCDTPQISRISLATNPAVVFWKQGKQTQTCRLALKSFPGCRNSPEALQVDLNEKLLIHSPAIVVGSSLFLRRGEKDKMASGILQSQQARGKKKLKRLQVHTHTPLRSQEFLLAWDMALAPGSREAPTNSYFIKNSPDNNKR